MGSELSFNSDPRRQLVGGWRKAALCLLFAHTKFTATGEQKIGYPKVAGLPGTPSRRRGSGRPRHCKQPAQDLRGRRPILWLA